MSCGPGSADANERPKKKRRVEKADSPAGISLERTMPAKVKLNLVRINGNAFFLMGAFQGAARKQGWGQADIDAVLDQCQSGNYDHLLQTLLKNTTTVGLHDEDE